MSALPEKRYRFACPACQRMLKAPVSWAGRRGACPACRHELFFPPPAALLEQDGGGAQTLLQLVSDKAPPWPEDRLDQLALFLAQGTCHDYDHARMLLAGRPLLPRQWRKVLPLAGNREALRLQLADAAEQGAAPGADGGAVPLLVPESTVDAVALAWEIAVRFQDFLRHGLCGGCQADPTGMRCLYLSFEDFGEMRNLDGEECRHWAKLCRQVFGLGAPAEFTGLQQ